MRWRDRRGHLATPPADTSPSDQERIVWLLINAAQAEIGLVYQNGDSHDVKALGLLGLDGAIIAALTAARAGLPTLWWVAVVALSACVPFFLFTIANQRFYFGPDLGSFYTANIERPALEAGVQLLADLHRHFHRNPKCLLPKA